MEKPNRGSAHSLAQIVDKSSKAVVEDGRGPRLSEKGEEVRDQTLIEARCKVVEKLLM